MYVEFENNKLVNTNFFGRVTKKDTEVDNVMKYLIIYELLSGEILEKSFDNESDRDDEYDSLLE